MPNKYVVPKATKQFGCLLSFAKLERRNFEDYLPHTLYIVLKCVCVTDVRHVECFRVHVCVYICELNMSVSSYEVALLVCLLNLTYLARFKAIFLRNVFINFCL